MLSKTLKPITFMGFVIWFFCYLHFNYWMSFTKMRNKTRTKFNSQLNRFCNCIIQKSITLQFVTITQLESLHECYDRQNVYWIQFIIMLNLWAIFTIEKFYQRRYIFYDKYYINSLKTFYSFLLERGKHKRKFLRNRKFRLE